MMVDDDADLGADVDAAGTRPSHRDRVESAEAALTQMAVARAQLVVREVRSARGRDDLMWSTDRAVTAMPVIL